MRSSPIQTLAWLLFAGIGVLFVIYGIYAVTLPSLQPHHWNFLTFDKDTVEYIGGTFRWLGMISIGFGILTAAISITSFRRGEKWAWYAFWLFPLFFAVAVPFTWPGVAWVPFVLLSAVALFFTAWGVFKDQRSG